MTAPLALSLFLMSMLLLHHPVPVVQVVAATFMAFAAYVLQEKHDHGI